jgi:hypothetical protein
MFFSRCTRRFFDSHQFAQGVQVIVVECAQVMAISTVKSTAIPLRQ